jgi:formiminoglutamase
MSIFSHLNRFAYTDLGTEDDPRLAGIIKGYTPEALEEATVVLLGVPTDEGVQRNGGRVGASKAPDTVRGYLGKVTTFSGDVSLAGLKIVDLGNIPNGPLEEMHDSAREIVSGEIVSELTRQKKIVITLGGGHDITYPLVKGHCAEISGQLNVINVDAHLDVRPLKNGLHHSGSSFRMLLEEEIVLGKNLHPFGTQRFVISEQHVRWLEAQGSLISFYDLIKMDGLMLSYSRILGRSGPKYLSFDVDAIRAADAPGVSAPAPVGFASEEAFWMCREAGRTSSLGMIDIVEMNPTYDVDDRTSRLVARMIANFLAGVTERNHH